MKIQYELIKTSVPHCDKGHRLLGNNSIANPYRCDEGVWRSNFSNPFEYELVEEFRDISGYESLYQVSNFGRIKSLERMVGHNYGGLKKHTERFLKSTSSYHGYLYINITNGISSKRFYIHRLVASTFLTNPENKSQVNHIDGNRSNNKITNLEWVTHLENQRYSWEKLNRKPNRKGKIGRENNYNSRKVQQFTQSGKLIKTWECMRDAGRAGFNNSCIFDCCKGKQKTHKGFIWKYF